MRRFALFNRLFWRNFMALRAPLSPQAKFDHRNNLRPLFCLRGFFGGTTFIQSPFQALN